LESETASFAGLRQFCLLKQAAALFAETTCHFIGIHKLLYLHSQAATNQGIRLSTVYGLRYQ